LSDLNAIRSAKAVILPQGCSHRLYEMARSNCSNVFPNYDARFRYAGKIGQTKLFRETATLHPETAIFHSVAEFSNRFPHYENLHLPVVFKFDWGGEGDTVFLVRSFKELADLVGTAARYEACGQKGFILQKFILSGNRSLRVVVIGKNMVSYWRTQEKPTCFHASVSKGAKVDPTSSPALKEAAERAVTGLCRRVGINLAGFDVIFAQGEAEPWPLLLEINYFFGRVGLGGSEEFYRLLRKEILRWLKEIGV
jgi:ribosomal protein S6--L-glutamate ligase